MKLAWKQSILTLCRLSYELQVFSSRMVGRTISDQKWGVTPTTNVKMKHSLYVKIPPFDCIKSRKQSFRSNLATQCKVAFWCVPDTKGRKKTALQTSSIPALFAFESQKKCSRFFFCGCDDAANRWLHKKPKFRWFLLIYSCMCFRFRITFQFAALYCFYFYHQHKLHLYFVAHELGNAILHRIVLPSF